MVRLITDKPHRLFEESRVGRRASMALWGSLLLVSACSEFNPRHGAQTSPSVHGEMLQRDHQGLPHGYIVKYNEDQCAQGGGAAWGHALEIMETYQDFSELDAGNMERFYDVETRPVASQVAAGVPGDAKMLNHVGGKVALSLSDVSQNGPSPFRADFVDQFRFNHGESVAQHPDQNPSMSGKGKGKGKGKAMSTAQASPSQGKVFGGDLPVQGPGLPLQAATPSQVNGQVHQGKANAQQMGAYHQAVAYHYDLDHGVAQGASAAFQGPIHEGVHQGKGHKGTAQSGSAWPGQQAKYSTYQPPSTTKHVLPSHHQGSQQAQSYGSASPDQGGSSKLSSASLDCSRVADMIRDQFRPVVSSSHFDNHYWGYFAAPREIAVGENTYFYTTNQGVPRLRGARNLIDLCWPDQASTPSRQVRDAWVIFIRSVWPTGEGA